MTPSELNALRRLIECGPTRINKLPDGINASMLRRLDDLGFVEYMPWHLQNVTTDPRKPLPMVEEPSLRLGWLSPNRQPGMAGNWDTIFASLSKPKSAPGEVRLTASALAHCDRIDEAAAIEAAQSPGKTEAPVDPEGSERNELLEAAEALFAFSNSINSNDPPIPCGPDFTGRIAFVAECLTAARNRVPFGSNRADAEQWIDQKRRQLLHAKTDYARAVESPISPRWHTVKKGSAKEERLRFPDAHTIAADALRMATFEIARALREGMLRRVDAIPIPAPPQPPRLILNVSKQTVSLDSSVHPLTERQTLVLNRLIHAQGGWVSGVDLRQYPDHDDRPDRVVRGLNKSLRKIIEAKPARGSRLLIAGVVSLS